MSAKTLDGKAVSQKIIAELKEKTKKLNYTPVLGVVMVGDNPASLSYIKLKKKMGESAGVKVKIYNLPEDISNTKLRKEVARIGKLAKIKGMLVQLPLPEHINTQYILNAVPPKKDVDVLGREMSRKFYTGTSDIFPITAAGIMRLLEEYNIEIKGKHAAVVGYGKLVGKPAAHLLAQNGADVTIITDKVEEKADLVSGADIVVSGVGKPGIITKSMVKKGAVVIDAGLAMENGELKGDTAENVAEVAGYITPTPGGVGPMTGAMLFWNLFKILEN